MCVFFFDFVSDCVIVMRMSHCDSNNSTSVVSDILVSPPNCLLVIEAKDNKIDDTTAGPGTQGRQLPPH